jgi:hypothetical protein
LTQIQFSPRSAGLFDLPVCEGLQFLVSRNTFTQMLDGLGIP